MTPLDLTNRKILVVDDDRLSSRLLDAILGNEGCRLEHVHSGERALEAYAQFGPDLVLLDVVMPGISGFETCRLLRKTHGDDCAPIVFVTAKKKPEDIVEGLSVGAADYLLKPLQPREVVARVRTQLTSRLLAEQQRALVEQLSQANAAKNRFLGMAAHDLRNPLTAIRGIAEFLGEGAAGPLTPDQHELVDTIRAASQSMAALVNELLDVATIEAGELKLSPAPHDLAELIGKSVHLARIEAAKKRMRITFQPPVPAPRAFADPSRLRQVIDNLISNAVKYSPPGSNVTVGLSGTPQTCTFSVTDQGPGIPDNERDRLFKAFGRLSTKPTGGEKSTGLGLAICRKIVHVHGGTIGATNLPGGGCEFHVTLPVPP